VLLAELVQLLHNGCCLLETNVVLCVCMCVCILGEVGSLGGESTIKIHLVMSAL
jgi:hypothetical protein